MYTSLTAAKARNAGLVQTCSQEADKRTQHHAGCETSVDVIYLIRRHIETDTEIRLFTGATSSG